MLGKEQLTLEEKNEKREFYKSIFNKFDKDKSGTIELDEFEEMLENDNVPKYIVEQVHRESDVNKNGVLESQEFEKMIENEDYKEVFSRYINIYIRYIMPKRIHVPQPDALYEEKYSCWPPPLALFIVTLLELIFFIVDTSSSEDKFGPTAEIFIYDPYKRQEAWRYLTYMFVHIGYTHLIVNLIVQLSLGVPLEMVHGGYRVLAVYFSGIIAGSLATSVLHPATYLAGASGGVYALITGHIGTIFMNWNEMEFPGVQLGFFSIIITLDIGSSIYNEFILHLNDDISYTAHIAGAFAGLLVGVWNLKNFYPIGEKHIYGGVL